MASSARVLIVGENRRIKRNQAVRLVEEHFTHCWVEKGYSVRKLTLAEMQAVKREAVKHGWEASVGQRLGYAEVPGLTFRLESRGGAVSEEMKTAREAFSFVVRTRVSAYLEKSDPAAQQFFEKAVTA